MAAAKKTDKAGGKSKAEKKVKAEKVTAIENFKVGDTVKVSVRIHEGDKDRIQAFSGMVISRRGKGPLGAFTVRRISHGVGVERVFSMSSPSLAGIEVEGTSRVRRAKLYYLRGRSGKRATLPKE